MIGVIIIAAVITVLIKFPINKTEKLVETDTSDVVETTSLQNESGQIAFSKIAFTSYRDGNPEIYIMNIDGSNKKNLTNNEHSDFYPCFFLEFKK